MAKEEFFDSLSTALRHWTPVRAETGARRGAAGVAVKLDRAALWLTEDAVSGFEPRDFQDLPDSDRAALDAAVTAFLEVARAIPLDRAADDQQYREGKELFERLTSILRAYLVRDWTDAVKGLIFDAKGWTENQGWHAKPQQTEPEIEEPLLGKHQLWQLQFIVDEDVFVLRPVARFVAGAGLLGVVDLIKTLSPYTVHILRKVDGWHLRIEAGKRAKSVRHLPWSEDAFLEAVTWLRSRE